MISVSEHGYVIVMGRAAGNFGAWASDLPGCVAVGDTIEEWRGSNVFHIDGLRRAGEPVPDPVAVAASVVDVA